MRTADLYSLIIITRLFLILIGVLCFTVSNLLPSLSIPMLALFGLAFWLRAKYTYINESFTRFYDGILFILIFFISSIFFGATTYIANSMLGMSLSSSITLGLSLPILMGAYYFYAKYKIPAPSSYEIKNNRIYPIQNPQRASPLAIGAAVAISAVLFPFLQGSTLYAAFLILFLAAASLVVMFYARNTIADLQQIKSEEHRLGIRYTFGNLEEIQAWRNRAWAPRLFRYFYTKLQSAFGQQ
ncbi:MULTISPECIES: hypothetical protein [unclassified Brenneria]|uniref:hypothetical protein n=1 Tax=unclassified Brenneria TaxID=2634434 RepID=UPI0018F0E988|nr:hypothetical protein [Brenneria sp. L3-3C-1]MBJ7223504.1 hypothetical protein [Brenneria sp. L3-3C-1]MEE3644745.1 hypothetical protein [Brenneria sp. L3_3C_1]